MAEASDNTIRTSGVSPWVRAGILLVSLLVLGLISWYFTGETIPRSDVEGLLVVGTLLFGVLGTLVLERYFTGPGDAFVNALSALVAIFPPRDAEPALACLSRWCRNEVSVGNRSPGRWAGFCGSASRSELS